MRRVLNAAVGYYEILRDNPDYRKLYLGQIVSLLGDWFNFIAVQTLVFELTQSGLATGLAIITSTLPAFFLTPIAGSIVDRFDRRKIMIAADLSRAVIALGMILVRTPTQIPIIYVLMALLVVFGSFFNPASSAAIPNLVRRDQLYVANGLSNSTWGLMLALGTLAGGVAISTVGMDLAFVINSLSFVFSATMLFLIHRSFGEMRTGHPRKLNPFADFGEGMRYAGRRPQILALLTVKAGGSLAAGVILLLTIFSFEVYHVGAIGIGLLQLARGVGILLGPLLAAPLVAGRIDRAQSVIALGFLVAGVGYAVFGTVPALSLGMIAVAFAHLGWGSNWNLSATLLQRLTPDEIRGRIFSMDIGLFTLTNALSTFLTGVATDRFDPRLVAFALGGVFIIYGLVWGAVVWSSRRQHPQQWHEGNLQGFDLPEEAWATVEQEAR
jgi:MFS family permease